MADVFGLKCSLYDSDENSQSRTPLNSTTLLKETSVTGFFLLDSHLLSASSKSSISKFFSLSWLAPLSGV